MRQGSLDFSQILEGSNPSSSGPMMQRSSDRSNRDEQSISNSLRVVSDKEDEIRNCEENADGNPRNELSMMQEKKYFKDAHHKL